MKLVVQIVQHVVNVYLSKFINFIMYDLLIDKI